MLKPELCPMHVECCEHCKEWEPIPFHDDGGVCLAEREMSVHRLSTPDFDNKGANLVAIKSWCRRYLRSLHQRRNGLRH